MMVYQVSRFLRRFNGVLIPAYRDVGTRPIDLFSSPTQSFCSGRGGRGEDFLFALDAPWSRQFAQQWRPRMMAQEAALKEAANSELRELLARNVEIGDSRGDVKIRRQVSQLRGYQDWGFCTFLSGGQP